MTRSDANGMTGGCQCGAIRFRVSQLGRASLCHCRMCQKALGGIGGAYVGTDAVTWTRGALKHFQSSNRARRGFCADCGTPLTFEVGSIVDIAIATFDNPDAIPPVIQLDPDSRIRWADALASLPAPDPEEAARKAATYAAIVSYQHPDHETDTWKAPRP